VLEPARAQLLSCKRSRPSGSSFPAATAGAVQPQGVVIVEILVTQRQGVQALGQQLLDGVVHQHLLARIVKQWPKRAKAKALIDLAQEQDAAITAEMAAGKVGLHLADPKSSKEVIDWLRACG